MDGVTLRRAMPGDAEAIRRLNVASVRELCRSHYTDEELAAWVRSYHREDYLKVMRQADGTMLVAERDGEMVGFGALSTEVGHVRAVYVHPRHAGCGVGSALLVALEDAARQAGLSILRLDASLNAVGFYARAGYREVSRFTHVLPSGIEIACVRMTKRLCSRSRSTVNE